MRIKARWFKPGAAKSPEDIAGAAAFIVWRTATNALSAMRKAGYAIDPGPQYFAFLAELLHFLVIGADRIAHARGDDAWRIAFTTAIVNRAGQILAENEADLLGAHTRPAIKRRFVEAFNALAVEYAGLGWTDDGPGFDFLRCLGHRVAEVMHEDDRSWAIAQVIDIEAPNAAATLRRGMAGLLDTTPRAQRKRANALSGE
jgi:hypothetical protein